MLIFYFAQYKKICKINLSDINLINIYNGDWN